MRSPSARRARARIVAALLLFLSALAHIVSPLASQARQTCAQASIDQFKQAAASHQQGSLEAASSLYERLLWLPGLPVQVAYQAANNLAAIQYGSGDTASAIRWWRIAVQHDPKSASANLNLALAHEAIGELHTALRHALLAAQLKPNNAPAAHLIGNLQQTLGNMKDAQKHWRAAEQAKETPGGDGTGAGTGQTPRRVQVCDRLLALQAEDAGQRRGLVWANGRRSQIEGLSSNPRIVAMTQAFSPETVATVLALAEHKVEESWAASSTSAADSTHRNSSSAWLRLGSHQLLVQFTNELAGHLGVPPQALRDSAEDLQVVRYEGPGQYFKAHHDSYGSLARPCTMLFYLSDPHSYDGGETWFPFARADGQSSGGDTGLPEGAGVARAIQVAHSSKTPYADGIAYKGLAGSAIVFANAPARGAPLPGAASKASGQQLLQAADPDPLSVHAGLAVSRGTKWVCNLWFRS